MPFSFVCSDPGVLSVTSAIVPGGIPAGTTNRVVALDNANFNNWGDTYKPLARNYPTNPSLGNCLIITPTTNDGEIKAYAFVINDVVNNLWQVPNNDGTPLVPIGTTYGSINDVINAVGNAGCIYFDQTGPQVEA
jgi:hypothetical protein